MPTQTKPSIVFAHGLWADGSCFSKVIPALQADGHEVMAAQNSLDTLEGDVAAVKRALGRVNEPGHSRWPFLRWNRHHRRRRRQTCCRTCLHRRACPG